MKLTCDYLVTGAGAASLAFIDTLLTEIPSAKVILVDKNAAPGGHWVHDYDFVRLHQPSVLYGVASKQLEGNWLKCLVGRRTLPWKHRATKSEILQYFQSFVEEKVASGQLEYYPECQYDFSQPSGDCNMHRFASLDGSSEFNVQVKDKFVNGILGECQIPSQCPVQFKVHEEVHIVTPNQLYLSHHEGSQTKNEQYIVLGCGKTAMDTVVFLLRDMKICPDDISWVIPNDGWMICREGTGGPWTYFRALLAADGDKEKACVNLEAEGKYTRLDKDIMPAHFRFPVIGKEELKYMRVVSNIVRKGRVSSIAVKEGSIKVSFGKDEEPWILPPSSNDHVFIHCTSPGPFNGKEADELFVSDTEMCLFLLYAPPVSISLSVLAKLESARRQGTLDLDFGRKLLSARSPVQNGNVPSDNDVLRQLVRGFKFKGDTPSQLISIVTLAISLALIDEDPMVGYEWMKANRLSFFSIPGFKSGIVKDLAKLARDGTKLGFTEGDIRVFDLLQEKLKPLEGK
mmetsp:Transcript_61241/g.181118  ORF Transcript_61241/g.181118 Transcript_61241/m.181118 type:complete len:514 (-) Transcript_61241:103-1644(-)